ncbi:hypothetical protein [Helicobacter sp. 11S02629-2]|uniref:hypothetical protein n=1 Tax=Helicobacter sp. 11S02629-2 TaxID=1476195 RepID=UPI000BA69264|nr:hypothetical protein [Helicobacter sp. 11S02629-2]PAF44174.1 hypothetical protein BKH40_06145 [Helicobacter sp. 11S02629-2]
MESKKTLTLSGDKLLSEAMKEALKTGVKNFSLLGAKTSNDETLLNLDTTNIEGFTPHIVATSQLEAGFYDENGILTYTLDLAKLSGDFDTSDKERYIYYINLLDNDNNVLITFPTSRVLLSQNIGGIFTIKFPISGTKNEVVFKRDEYIVRTEFESLKAKVLENENLLNATILEVNNKINQINTTIATLVTTLKLQSLIDNRVGELAYFAAKEVPKGYYLVGTLVKKAKYAKLYAKVQGLSNVTESDDNFMINNFTYVKGTNSTSDVLQTQTQALPNIRGKAWSGSGNISVNSSFFGGETSANTEGVFFATNNFQSTNRGAGSFNAQTNNHQLNIDASRASNIYKDNSGVELQAFKLLTCIFADPS